MNIVFFGTDNFALHVLDVLHKHHNVVAVVTTPDAKVGRKQTVQLSPVALLAQDLQLKTLKPITLKNDVVLESELRSFNADIFVVVVYGKIIPQNILSIPPQGCLNVHPSLLPLYRGPSPIRTPLLNGDTITGVTIMLMDDQVDHGPILAQEEVSIEGDDNNITLTEKLAQAAAPLLLNAIDGYTSGQINPKEQDHTHATVTKIITKDDGNIDWNQSVEQIYNKFRAFYDWPGIWTTWNGQVLKITDCSVITPPASLTTSHLPLSGEDNAEFSPPDKGEYPALAGGGGNSGTILPGGLVTCGSGTILQIRQLQLAGKNATDIQSFLHGYRNFVGTKLGM